MPTVFDPNLQQTEEKKQQQQQVVTGEPIGIGAQGASTTPGAQKPTASGQFTNIQSYLNANKSNNLGQQVQDKFGEIKDQGVNKLNESKQQFDSEASKTGAAIADQRQAVQNSVNQLGGSDEEFQKGYGSLQSGMNMQYQGPQGMGNTASLQCQAQNLSDLGNMTGSGAGRFTLLQKFFGTPNYTQGQTRLDNLLLGSQGKDLANTRRIANSLGTQINDVNQQAQSQVGQLQNDVSQVRDVSKEAANSGASNLKDTLTRKLQEYADTERANQATPSYSSPINLNASIDTTQRYNNGEVSGLTSGGGVKDFSLNLDPGQARTIGLLKYNPGVDLATLNDPSQQSQLLGRADPTLANRYNSLKAMLGDTNSIAVGDKLQNGSYQLGDQTAANQEFNDLIQSQLDRTADFNTLQDTGGVGTNGYVDPTSQTYRQVLNRNNDTGYQYATPEMQARIKSQITQNVLNALLSKYAGYSAGGGTGAPGYLAGPVNTAV